ncbi:glycosyltransferase family 2 protein [Motilibacter deserti]|uniref:Glycosyltransferase family 2 protein n=1 Tax=Motilibacter deserti TaxID=2714956 RepID=A0ABX0GZP5_9ACTN|nr:glycosyltransferase family 2 protein [Motilibacter deserti]NHC16429.1 glycosyltransferase family 2 protein [Motilibacter deserti]
MTNKDTCLVVPVYNEAAVVREVVEEALTRFEHVICVDDGSTDDSAAQVQLTNAVLVRHPVNLGQGAALQTGIEYALHDPSIQYLVTFDSDGQHRLDDAERMVEQLRRDEADIVFGSRFLDSSTQVGGLKRVVLKLAVHYTNLTSGVHLTDAHNGLRAFNRRVAETLNIRRSGMAHASEIVETVGKAKLRYVETPVTILYTDYSKAKGQSVLNSVNILFDLFFR